MVHRLRWGRRTPNRCPLYGMQNDSPVVRARARPGLHIIGVGPGPGLGRGCELVTARPRAKKTDGVSFATADSSVDPILHFIGWLVRSILGVSISGDDYRTRIVDRSNESWVRIGTIGRWGVRVHRNASVGSFASSSNRRTGIDDSNAVVATVRCYRLLVVHVRIRIKGAVRRTSGIGPSLRRGYVRIRPNRPRDDFLCTNRNWLVSRIGASAGSSGGRAGVSFLDDSRSSSAALLTEGPRKIFRKIGLKM